MEAYDLLAEYYIWNVGVTPVNFMKVVGETFPNAQISEVPGLLPSEFIRFYPFDNYLVISPGHVFAIRYRNGRWELYGNEKDCKEIIGIAIRLNTKP
jgi:hypothetical protein